MAGRELRANIVLGGRVDNSFYAMGSALEALGALITPVSRELIEFGKESVKTYVDYEDAMLDAQVALATQYDTTSQLSKAMEQLDKAAMEWASSSRFTTDDVAGAIANATHAGWDLEEVLAGVPEAMNISLAGGMDLAQGLEYLVDIVNAAGLEFEELGELTDYWAYAANSSSTTIPEMGQAMQRMGATMQFVKGDMAGLTTMLAVLADNGSKGMEAGTLLRNSMIRLIAPTKKAAEAMDMLELSEEDLEDIYSDTEGLEEAIAMLEEAGFSAYDSGGDLKSFLTIWKELDKTTSKMTEEKRNNILSAIFPTRTITGALALLEAASEDWDGLYDSILGKSSGYADYARDTMESGLGGALREVEAAWDVLQAKTGKELSGPVGGIANSLSEMINAVNNMDEAQFSVLVSSLETIAMAGPALTTAGIALKLIGSLGIGGGIGLAAVGLAALAAAVDDMNRSIYEDKFGDITLDEGTIGSYLSELGKSFAAAQEDIDKYNKAVEKAIGDYTEASGTFKESLITKILTGATLTKEDIETLNGLGDQMRMALLEGIDGSYSASEEALLKLGDFASVDEGVADDGMGGQILALLNVGYEDAIDEAKSLSRKLRDAMTSAFEDKSLTNEEIDSIQSILDQQNKLLAEQTSEEMWLEEQKLLRQAQTLGLEGLEQYAGQVETLRDEQWELRMQDYDKMRWDTDKTYAKYKGETINGVTYDEAWRAQQQAWLDERIAVEKQEHYAHFDETLIKGYINAIQGSELREPWDKLTELAEMYFAGEISGPGALKLMQERYGDNAFAGFPNIFDDSTSTELGDFLARYIASLGGQEAVAERIAHLKETGKTEEADELSLYYAMEQILNNYAKTDVQEGTAGHLWDGEIYSSAQDPYGGGYQANRDNFEAATNDAIAEYSADVARRTVEYFSDGNGGMGEVFKAIAEAGEKESVNAIVNAQRNMSGSALHEFGSLVDKLDQIYDYDRVLEGDSSYLAGENNPYRFAYAAWKLMYDDTINAEDYRIRVVPEIDQAAMEGQIGEYSVPIDIKPPEEGDGLAELEEQGVKVSVDGDTTELEATIDGSDAQTLLEYVDGDATDLEMSITDQDGETLLEYVTGDTAALAEALAAYEGRTITVNIRGKQMFSGGGDSTRVKAYAEGGRATEASIFGEAGPEWAIPEEHSQRTAELLSAAREASGFTWGELLSRNGGLNAGRRSAETIVYSPTIYAQNADGVEEKLIEDKARLERMLREREMRDDIEVYA